MTSISSITASSMTSPSDQGSHRFWQIDGNSMVHRFTRACTDHLALARWSAKMRGVVEFLRRHRICFPERPYQLAARAGSTDCCTCLTGERSSTTRASQERSKKFSFAAVVQRIWCAIDSRGSQDDTGKSQSQTMLDDFGFLDCGS